MHSYVVRCPKNCTINYVIHMQCIRNILLETFLAEILHFIKLCYYEFNSAWLVNSAFLAWFPYGRNGRKD